jgi:EAL domain-containing protein (putative c-di-GMP-specific phosphodiesterase class I)
MGCDVVQGYLLARPQAAMDVSALMLRAQVSSAH